MKKVQSFFREHKLLTIGLSILIAIVLFIVGKDSHTEGAVLANATVVALTEAEKEGFTENEQKVILAVKKLTVQLKEQVNSGKIDKTQLDAALSGLKTELSGNEIKQLQDEIKSLEDAAKEQGTTLATLKAKMETGEGSGFKSIGQVLKEDEAELRKVATNGIGVKYYMININHKGEPVMKAFDPNARKAAATHGTVDGIASGSTASVSSSISTSTILRLAADAPIVSQYRNTPWVFDLCNLINVSYETPFAIWYEEQAKQGASNNVNEGGTKPLTQYSYIRKSTDYKKEATLLSFSEEFSLDFAQLQSDIMGKGRTDLINRINTAVLSRIVSNATPYNSQSSFGNDVPSVNDFDVIAAMAAQVDNATFGGAMANSAVMSTYKKYKMGITKSLQGEYLNKPSVLDNIAFIGNPAMGANDILVGDLKQYNIMLRGGLIVRVGYNGTDFAENKFSVVMEQFYLDWISEIRKSAIVTGPDFATIKALIGAS